MTLTKYQRMSYKWLGRVGEKRANQHLQEALQSAHMEIRAGAYLSYVILSAIIGFLSTMVVIVLFVFLLLPLVGVGLDAGLTVFFLFIPGFIGVLIYAVLLSLPKSKAKGRKKKIDVNLAYAINFISAMASAGITPTEIFKSLSKQDIYGEVKEESAWIYRDVGLLGLDILTAIKKNIARTPSQKFKEFLQGMTVTVTSGGSLKTYFMHKADQYLWENRNTQKQLLETLGIMAESYVTAAVAGVLLLLIVIPLMMIISGAWNATFLYILILVVVPLIHVGFAVVIRMICQGA
ncbi:MAG TPA: type II secretion system F family protein [Candidatus Thermoplasmatota archaeon]|nr:type II secretion system F family protein [Candidatus Thermoplasmatota archaeon]